MNRHKKRNGFTIVELVIVVAIIAVLAAILIPTFSGILDKAHRSADQHLVRSINTVLSTETLLGNEITSVEQVKEALAENGIRSLELSCDDHVLYWVKDENCIILCDTKENLVVMPEEFKGPIQEDKINSGEWVLITGDISSEDGSQGGSQSGDPAPTDPELDTSDIADYVIEEADRVIQQVSGREYGGSVLTFIAASDMHEMSIEDHADSAVRDRNATSNKHAGQGAALIADRMEDVDFLALLGDYTWGGENTTTVGGQEAIRQVMSYYADAMTRVEETLITTGDHDALKNSLTLNGDDYLSNSQLNEMYGQNLDKTYRSIDLTEKKVRLILLDTADMEGSATAEAERIGTTQRQWFADTLKSTPADYGIIILSHHPLDWGNIRPAANILQAYLTGNSYNDGNATYDFADITTPATVIAQFHGHVHSYAVDYIHHDLGGSNLLTTVPRICIPNAGYSRNNEYGRGGMNSESGDYTYEASGLEFGDAPTYDITKPQGTAEETAFCVITIDLENRVIYADSYGFGAGAYDRIVDYSTVNTHTITLNGQHVSISNDATGITQYTNYKAILSAADGYTLSTPVQIKMGGRDITDVAYNETTQTVYIHHVTGDIEITATAIQVKSTFHVSTGFPNGNITLSDPTASVTEGDPYTVTLKPSDEYTISYCRVTVGGQDVTDSVYSNGTVTVDSVSGDIHIIAYAVRNLVPLSVDVDGTPYQNGNGYQNGVYVSSTGNTTADPDFVTTGYIPYIWDPSNVLYIKGASLTIENHTRIFGYSSLQVIPHGSASGKSGDKVHNEFFSVETLGDNYYRLTPKASIAGVVYIRISLKGTGENLIITLNEPIE